MGTTYLRDLEAHLEGGNVRIASVHGRYFAMDRDKRWERIARSYAALTGAIDANTRAPSPASAIRPRGHRRVCGALPNRRRGRGGAPGDVVLCSTSARTGAAKSPRP